MVNMHLPSTVVEITRVAASILVAADGLARVAEWRRRPTSDRLGPVAFTLIAGAICLVFVAAIWS